MKTTLSHGEIYIKSDPEANFDKYFSRIQLRERQMCMALAGAKLSHRTNR